MARKRHRVKEFHVHSLIPAKVRAVIRYAHECWGMEGCWSEGKLSQPLGDCRTMYAASFLLPDDWQDWQVDQFASLTQAVMRHH